jgi:predicted DNA-binding protein YlxM (UPF0122 family)
MHQIAELPLSQYHPLVRAIWRSRTKELEQEVFEKQPNWMSPEPTSEDDRRDMKILFEHLLETLTKKEAAVLRCRYWKDQTLEETGRVFDVTRERIRQIEQKALRKLRHPSRSDHIRPFADELPEARAKAKKELEVRYNLFLKQEIASETKRAKVLNDQICEEVLLQKYLQYKANRLAESIRVST